MAAALLRTPCTGSCFQLFTAQLGTLDGRAKAGSSLSLRNQDRLRVHLSLDPNADTASSQGPSIIDLEFFGPDPSANENVYKTSVPSGEKLLRNIMLDNKLELYGLYGKVMNCGGGGSCGTCVVEILEGQNLLNERTNAENRHLKKKPESWRLSCQTIVGNKANSGKVLVQRLPQRKKQ